jgi:VanZ family protein
MLKLRYRLFWIVASIVLLLGVVWGSLQTSVSPSVAQGFDKFQHFGTYMLLAVWFTGLYARPRWWLVMVGLLGLGLSMEVAQYLMHTGRMAEGYDMVANAAGVLAGLLLGGLLTGGWAQRVESWVG